MRAPPREHISLLSLNAAPSDTDVIALTQLPESLDASDATKQTKCDDVEMLINQGDQDEQQQQQHQHDDEMEESVDNQIDDDETEQEESEQVSSLDTIPKVHKNDLIRGLLDRKFQCKWCLLRFFSKSQLKEHESTHSNSVLFCPVCDKHFNNKERLSGHMKCHMEPSLECKVCGKKFKRLCNLYNHELVHGLTEHAFMLCQFCGRGFRSRRDYQNHVIANHREQIMNVDQLTQQQSLVESSSGSGIGSGDKSDESVKRKLTLSVKKKKAERQKKAQ